jgi:ferredoxin
MTMYRIKADLDVCQGFAVCVNSAPDLFELDDDDLVVVLKEEITDEELPRADLAVKGCPVVALSLEEA